MNFLLKDQSNVSFSQKIQLIQQLYRISEEVSCPHLQSEIIAFIEVIFALPVESEGYVVEAGCYKGGSTAKFSLACKIAGRKMMAFDSFEGIPENDERNKDGSYVHQPGIWCGTMQEVSNNIEKYGNIGQVELVMGLFENTLPKFKQPIAAAYIDVDLASSTMTCLKYLYPLVVPGGVLISQDGHLSRVIDVYDSAEFWKEEVGFPKPHIAGLGRQKLITIVKPADSLNISLRIPEVDVTEIGHLTRPNH